MLRSLTNLSVLAWFCAAAWPAALVPVPPPPQPTLPPAGLEANQGQAKAGILFLARGSSASLAVTAQSVVYSPLGGALTFVASNPNPTVSFSDPLPGLVNSYTGADSHKWVTGIPRYATATLGSVYPGISAQYTISSDGSLTLNLELAPGVDPQAITFQVPQALSITVNPDGSLTATFIDSRLGPRLVYPAPAASQPFISRPATFVLRSANTFGVEVLDLGSTGLSQGLQISIPLNGAAVYYPPDESYGSFSASDAAGNTFFAATIADTADKAPPFPGISGAGCGLEIATPVACTDVAIYKYSAAGTLQFITYLEGGVNETPGFVGLTPDGKVAVAGTTDSADFPVTSGAFQTSYAGPPPANGSGVLLPDGDFFAALLDPAMGRLQSATFFGSPNPDTLGTAAIGTDGSLYFLPAFIDHFSAGLPASAWTTPAPT